MDEKMGKILTYVFLMVFLFFALLLLIEFAGLLLLVALGLIARQLRFKVVERLIFGDFPI